MSLKLKIALISILIISLIAGGALILKIFTSEPKTTEAAAVNIKANSADGETIVSYKEPVALSWNFSNADRCFISNARLGIMPVSDNQSSGSALINSVTNQEIYTITCSDKNGELVSDSVVVNVSQETAPLIVSAVSPKEMFPDFYYEWEKSFCKEKRGDADTKALQIVLFLEGFISSPKEITGDFDETTSEALKRFQEDYELEPVGCVGPKTVAKLNELYGYQSIALAKIIGSAAASKNGQTGVYASQTLFNAGDMVRAIADIGLYNEKCDKIGMVLKGTLMVILNQKEIFCSIGGKKFKMRNVRILKTGQIGWVAEAFLEKASGLANKPQSDKLPPESLNATSSQKQIPTVDIKADYSDGPVKAPPGYKVSLSWWASSDSETCVASGDWSGNKPIIGEEKTEQLNEERIYKFDINCSNSAGFTSDSVEVEINSAYAYSSNSNQNQTGGPAVKINELNPDKWDINPFCAPAVALTVNIKGSGFDSHDNELETGWSTVKNLDSKDGENIVAKIEINDDLIKKVQYEKYKIKYYTAKWKIKNSNGTSDEKDFVVFASCPLW